MSTVSSKPIGMPKHVQATAEAFKNQMTKRPTTTLTAKDVMVNKYADLAQRIYDSKSVRNSRTAYDIAKNSVTAGLKGEVKNETNPIRTGKYSSENTME